MTEAAVGTGQPQIRKPLAAAVTAAVALVLGYLVLQIVNMLIDALWSPDAIWGAATPVPAMLLLPALAGLLVGLIRKHGPDGHDPLAGLAVGAVKGHVYPGLVGAILLTLAGGLVLGPEAALVVSGGMVGTVVGIRSGLERDLAVKIATLFAVLSLGVGPLINHDTAFSRTYAFAWAEVPAVFLGAAATLVLLTLVRLGARWLAEHIHAGRAQPWKMAVAGLAVGAVAVVYTQWTGQPVEMVLTSGEGSTQALVAMGGTGLILVTVLAKSVGYTISLGSGFRGGPFFPAMFAGAGLGAVCAGLLGVGPHGAAVAGLLAAVTYLAQLGWRGSAITALVVGFLVGGWELMPMALVGALIGRLVPRVDPHAPQAPEGEPEAGAAGH